MRWSEPTRKLRRHGDDEVMNHGEFSLKIGLAAAVATLGAWLYFREHAPVFGISLPDYTGLIITFAAVMWMFYLLFSRR